MTTTLVDVRKVKFAVLAGTLEKRSTQISFFGMKKLKKIPKARFDLGEILVIFEHGIEYRFYLADEVTPNDPFSFSKTVIITAFRTLPKHWNVETKEIRLGINQLDLNQPFQGSEALTFRPFMFIGAGFKDWSWFEFLKTENGGRSNLVYESETALDECA